MGNSAPTTADLSLAWLRGKPALEHSSQAESRLPTALLLVPAVLQPAKGACLLMCRTSGLGRPVCGFFCSFPRAGVYPLPLLSPISSESPPKGTGPDPIAFLVFLPNYLYIFLIALVVESCQFPVSFQ